MSRLKFLIPVLLATLAICCCRPPLEATAQPTQTRQQTGDRDENKVDRAAFMRGKLNMVQKIIEGLSTDDFDLVQSGSLDLIRLSESATWKSLNDPFYRHYSANFEQAVRGLLTAAKSGSPEKTTFAYVHVTMSCMACHQHVRRTRRVAGQ